MLYVIDSEFVAGNPIRPISFGITKVIPPLRVWRKPYICDCASTPCSHDLATVAYNKAAEAKEKAINSESSLYVEFEGAAELARSTPWLRENVAPGLLGVEQSIPEIREKLISFVGDDKEVRIAASYGAYDFFIMAEIVMGGFQNFPQNFPYFFIETADKGLPLVEAEGPAHNALADALTIRKAILAGRENGLNL